MTRHAHAGGAVRTTITSDIGSSATSITLDDSTGWSPGGVAGPAYATLRDDTETPALEERIEYESLTGDTLTLASSAKRGIDGTAAMGWASGTTIEHTIAAEEIDLFDDHVHDTARDDHTQYHTAARHASVSHTTSMISTGTPGGIAPDDSASAGAATSLARSDHRHSVTTAVAGTIAPDDTADEGVATSFARSDHRHAIAAGTASTVTNSNAEGSSSSFARADHNHAYGTGSVPTAALVNGAVTPAKTTVTYARVRRSSNQAVGSAVASDVVWNLEEADTGSFWTSGTPQRFTIANDGVVEVTFNARFEPSTTGRRQIRIVHTTSGVPTIVAEASTDGISTDPTALSCSTGPLPVVATEYFTFVVIQESGGSLDLLGDALGTRGTNASIEWKGV